MTATEASRHFSDVLDRARAGETITVVRNGQAVAQVTPPPARKPSGAAMIEFLRAWEGDEEGFPPDYLEWLDSSHEPNERDKERMAWADGLR